MAKIVVYGIPTCGTVKKARSWLANNNIAHEFVDFRASPPPSEMVEQWVAEFGNKALRNTSGGAYRDLGADKDEWTDARWSKEFHQNPMLIKRPVVTREGAAMLVGWTLSEAELKAKFR